LADRRDPPPQTFGPASLAGGVAFGRFDDVGSVISKPPEVVFGGLETLVGYVGPASGRTRADEPLVRSGSLRAKKVSAIFRSAVEAAPKQKPVMTPLGSTAVNKLKPSYHRGLLDRPMSA
jgi:hypothetical protein